MELAIAACLLLDLYELSTTGDSQTTTSKRQHHKEPEQLKTPSFRLHTYLLIKFYHHSSNSLIHPQQQHVYINPPTSPLKQLSRNSRSHHQHLVPSPWSHGPALPIHGESSLRPQRDPYQVDYIACTSTSYIAQDANVMICPTRVRTKVGFLVGDNIRTGLGLKRVGTE